MQAADLCKDCGASFPSRNRLFKHLAVCLGAAAITNTTTSATTTAATTDAAGADADGGQQAKRRRVLAAEAEPKPSAKTDTGAGTDAGAHAGAHAHAAALYGCDGPYLCGAYGGALLCETSLTQRVVAALKTCGAHPEAYREPPGRRTRVLWASHLQGRFGNPVTVAPLGEGVPLEDCRAVPVIEPGPSMFESFAVANGTSVAAAAAPTVAAAGGEHAAPLRYGAVDVPNELLELLRSGRVAWRPTLNIPTTDDVAREAGKAGADGGTSGRRAGAVASALSSSSAAAAAAANAIASPAPQPAPPSAATARFRFAELFAGIGGFRLGLEAIGGRCVFASEMDERARALYAENFGAYYWWY